MDIYFKIVSVPAIVTGISTIIFSSVLIPTLQNLNQKELSLESLLTQYGSGY